MFVNSRNLKDVPLEEKTNPATFNLPKEIKITKWSIFITAVLLVFVINEFYEIFMEMTTANRWSAVLGHVLFIGIASFLIYGGLVYQFCRLGSLKRRAAHKPVSAFELETFFEKHSPSLTLLVPSYKEEERVVYLTLMSAAFQDYPVRRVALLIDDPPNPTNPDDLEALRKTRELPVRINNMLYAKEVYFQRLRSEFTKRIKEDGFHFAKEISFLAKHYGETADWFGAQAKNHPIVDNADSLYVEKVLLKKQAFLKAKVDQFNNFIQSPPTNGSTISDKMVLKQYGLLVSLFKVQIVSFERKIFENLSHESNKAMNLNSYIGLVGKSFKEKIVDNKRFLEESDIHESDFHVPDTDYFITLDADSILLPEYSSRLIHFLEQPENERVGVAQTPYSAIPNPSGILERIAGATTDIQYIIHQGFTNHDATYWVGANALLRKTALLDIVDEVEERGYKVPRFIHDRTVIEDTESSIDLVDKNWRLYNYPERMAYSATPPDFGSLLIQRRRWANGGLIILPKLLRYLKRGPIRLNKLCEAFMRIHYLISIAAVNVGLLLLLTIPFTENIKTLWLPATALPYFFLYMRDLTLIGYRYSDMARVYALNLLLIPVNLGGVFKSLEQSWTKRKIPFGRTPKILGKTSVAPLYIYAIYALIINWTILLMLDFDSGRYGHGLFTLANTTFLAYALIQFIGLKESKNDVVEQLPQGIKNFFTKQTVLPHKEDLVEEITQYEFVKISEQEKTGTGKNLY